MQFLQHYQLCTMSGTRFDALGQIHQVGTHIRDISLLDNTDFYFLIIYISFECFLLFFGLIYPTNNKLPN